MADKMTNADEIIPFDSNKDTYYNEAIRIVDSTAQTLLRTAGDSLNLSKYMNEIGYLVLVLKRSKANKDADVVKAAWIINTIPENENYQKNKENILKEYPTIDPAVFTSMEDIYSKYNNKLVGGEADDYSLEDIAKKHNVSYEFIQEQAYKGQAIELEHTDNPVTALEIAKDHLNESPNYYIELEKMEEKLVITETTQPNMEQESETLNKFRAAEKELQEASDLWARFTKGNEIAPPVDIQQKHTIAKANYTLAKKQLTDKDKTEIAASFFKELGLTELESITLYEACKNKASKTGKALFKVPENIARALLNKDLIHKDTYKHTGGVVSSIKADMFYESKNKFIPTSNIMKESIVPKLDVKYKLGDMWSSDFDDEGMIKYAVLAELDWGVENLTKLHNSMEDNNFHTLSKHLWDTIQYLKENDIDEAEVSLNLFKEVVRDLMRAEQIQEPYYPQDELKDMQEAKKQAEKTTRTPKFKVGDYVSYETGDVYKRTAYGLIVEVKDFDTEYAYRVDAYINTEDGLMFDPARNNEVYEAVLKLSTKEAYNNAKNKYEKEIAERKAVKDNSVKQTAPQKPMETKQTRLNKNQQYELNSKVVELVQANGIDRTKYSESELTMLGQYSGHGGLKNQYETEIKEGKIKDFQGFLFEFYTPELVVNKMWGLAYKHGFEGKAGDKVLEPSCGVGRFLKLVPNGCKATAFEIDKVSYTIAKVLYPRANVNLKSFETEFFMGSESLGNVIRNRYNLIIGNPPYGEYNSEYSSQEKKHTLASQFDHYFIMRGVDSLIQGGLLIFIIPSAFLQNNNKYNDFKEMLSKKAELIDAYRLPENAFDNTSIGTDIIVLRKK